MTNYVYYRVSTDMQTIESQKMGVQFYCQTHSIKIDKEVADEGVSGKIDAKDRNLGKLLKILQKNDTLVVAELSRLGRSVKDVLNTCDIILQKQVKCIMIKENIIVDDSPMGRLMITILSALAELERNLISQRTKEGLARVKASGKHLGRIQGSKNIHCKWTEEDFEKASKLLNKGNSFSYVAKKCKMSSPTLKRYVLAGKIQYEELVVKAMREELKEQIRLDREDRKLLLLEEKRLREIEEMERKKAERQAKLEQSIKKIELKQKERELEKKLNKLRNKFAQAEKEQIMINGKEEYIIKDYVKDIPNENKASCKCGTKPMVVNIDGCFYAQCPKCNKNKYQFIGLNPERALDNWNNFHNRKYYNKEKK